jgi:hypothetical protein
MHPGSPSSYLIADRYGDPLNVQYISKTLNRVRLEAGIPPEIQTRDLLAFARHNPY